MAVGTKLQVKNGKLTEYEFKGAGRLLDPALLVDDDHLGLVVDALFGNAAEVAEGLIVQLDEALGVQRCKAHAHIHQAAFFGKLVRVFF